MASRAGTPTPWTIPLQATRVLLARAPTTLLLHRRAGLTRPNAVSHRWASVEPSVEPSVGPTHACQTTPLEHVDPPGLPHKLLLGTSSRQISNAYLGGNLSLVAVLHYIAFWGFTGFGPFPARSPPPGQHTYNVLPYTPNTHYVYCASRCKCEIVKWKCLLKVIAGYHFDESFSSVISEWPGRDVFFSSLST